MVKYLLATLAIAPTGLAQISMPNGFEVVEISSSETVQHGAPAINDCGQIVFNLGPIYDDSTEILLYDNGQIIQVTDNDYPDSFPDINNNGEIAWTENYDGSGTGLDNVVLLSGDSLLDLGSGNGPSINNLGQVAWDWTDWQTCAFETVIYFYDGAEVSQITTDTFSNQGVTLNDQGWMVWTRYDLCVVPWQSEIMLYDGQTEELPDSDDQPVSPFMNNVGQVIWESGDGEDIIHIWDNGVVSDLGEGAMPAINDLGDVATDRNDNGMTYWQIWIYYQGDWYQITDDPMYHHIRPTINNYGEVAWWWIPNGLLTPAGVNYLRRIRNGDVVLDSVVNELDYAAMPDCLTGPGDYDRLCDCRFYDIGHDRDVDLADFAVFQNHFGRQVYYYGDGTWGFDPPPPPPPSTCCSTGHGPGCDDEDGEACVCAALPACCLADWTDACVALYEAACGGTCE